MTTDFKENIDGEQVMFLDCPMCDFADDIVYRTKEPTYCSNACRQRAKRQRKKAHSAILERNRILDQLTLDTLNQLSDYDVDRLVGHLKGRAKLSKMNRYTGDEMINTSMRVLYEAMAEYINVSVKATRINKTS